MQFYDKCPFPNTDWPTASIYIPMKVYFVQLLLYLLVYFFWSEEMDFGSKHVLAAELLDACMLVLMPANARNKNLKKSVSSKAAFTVLIEIIGLVS